MAKPEADMIMTVRDTIAAIKPCENSDFAWFMVDSGACVTCATEGEFDVPIDETKKKTLYSVQGLALKVYGEQTPGIELDDGLRGTIRVTVTDASENVLAVDELLSKDWEKVVFGKAGSYLEYKNGRKYPLTKFGKRWWMRVRKRDLQALRSQGADNRIAASSEDSWRRDGSLLVRVHSNPRRNLFSPLDSNDCPVDPSELENGRLTRMTFVGGGGEDVLEDFWDTESNANRRLAWHWVGETCFKLKDDAASAQAEPEAPDPHVQHGMEHAHFMEETADRPIIHPMSSPPEPSPQERAEHNLHHATYASWCPRCVAGQGRQAPHMQRHTDTPEHIVYADFMYFSSKGEEVQPGDLPEGADGGDVVTVLTAIDKDSRWPFAVVIPSKKIDDPNSYAVKSLETWLLGLGWKQFTFQTDQEPAIMKLANTVRKKMGHDKMQVRQRPRYSSQSLAEGETVNQQIAGRVRTWVSVLSEQYQVDIRNTHRLFPWIVRHVAWAMARLHVNTSRTTPFRIIKGHDFFGELLAFGECVLAKWPNMKDLAKGVPRWVHGVFVGKTEGSDEHIVLTPVGAQTFRTVRRLPGSSRHSLHSLESVAGLPWDTKDGSSKVQPAIVVSKPGVEFVPVLPPVLAHAPAAPSADAKQAVQDEDALALRAPKKPKLQADNLSDARMSDEPQQFNIATPRDSNQSPASSIAHCPSSAYDPSVRSRSPPRELPDEAGNAAPSQVPGAGGMEVETGMGSISAISDELLAKFVEGDETACGNTIADVVEFLDTCLTPEERHMARLLEIKKLEEVFRAFTPRDARALPPNIRVFNHVWVDKKSGGLAKSRLTCADVKQKLTPEQRLSSEGQSNFCPTPHPASLKNLEVYSLLNRFPRAKADLTSAFLIARDSGDDQGQPTCLRPPQEWLDDYDTWLLKQDTQVQQDLANVPKQHIVWQVDGNIYGRQPAAAAYRQELENILLHKLDGAKYKFQRGKVDACVYRCKLSGVILIHHIDDFDVCGPAEAVKDLLEVQLPKVGCKLKVGDLEGVAGEPGTSSEYLGREKYTIDDCVVTKPNDKHVQNILGKLGMEDAKPAVLPGRKLDLSSAGNMELLSDKEKETYASCVGSGIYLSQDRADVKFAVKELARRLHAPRRCDFQNLKVFARYLVGTTNYGHVSKLVQDLNPEEALPLHACTDSDWAGCEETRKSSSGEVIVLAGTVVETGSTTQPGVPATSSGEAEIRSWTHCAQSSVYVRNLACEDFGLKVDTPRVWCDSSAALQAAKRIGMGKMRHVAVGHMYIQELVQTKQVIIGKVDGVANPANTLTKHLATSGEMLASLDGLGIIDLTDKGFDEHVRCTKLKVVSSVSFKKWKPLMASTTSLRGHNGAILRRRRVLPGQRRETPQ